MASQKAFPVVGIRCERKRKPETFTLSFRAPISLDILLRSRADQLRRSKADLLNEIVSGALGSVTNCGQARQSDPLLAEIAGLYRAAKQALADGAISPLEREVMTDMIADALHEVRTRRTA